jgi:hypothetical protein
MGDTKWPLFRWTVLLWNSCSELVWCTWFIVSACTGSLRNIVERMQYNKHSIIYFKRSQSCCFWSEVNCSHLGVNLTARPSFWDYSLSVLTFRPFFCVCMVCWELYVCILWWDLAFNQNQAGPMQAVGLWKVISSLLIHGHRPPETSVRSGILKRVDNIKSGRGRPKLTWDKSVKRDMKKWNISKDLAMDRSA